MSRKRRAVIRSVTEDPIYKSIELTKFINRMMKKGKKTISAMNMYKALKIIEEKLKKPPLEVFEEAIKNCAPDVMVNSRRVGGSTYQVPVDVRPSKRQTLAHKWIIQAARSKKGKPFKDFLAAEIIDAYNRTGLAFKKKTDTHKMAEANRAFVHYRW